MRGIERITVFLINIFCPPLSVMLVAGPGPDFLINTLLFLAGVIPGHIHGFYITCTYFHRKRRVRKGRYPGGRKRGIYSQTVWNGGASNARVRELWEKKREDEKEEERRRIGKRGKSWGGSIRSSVVGGDEEKMWKRGSGGSRSQARSSTEYGSGRDMREVHGWRM